MRLSTEEKQMLVAPYHAGESAAEICADTGIARSTFYTWDQALYCDCNRFRLRGQPTGIHEDEAENPKTGRKD